MADNTQFNSAQFLALFPPSPEGATAPKPTQPSGVGAPRKNEKASPRNTSSFGLAPGMMARPNAVASQPHAVAHASFASAAPVDLDLPFPPRGGSFAAPSENIGMPFPMPHGFDFGGGGRARPSDSLHPDPDFKAATPKLPCASPNINLNTPVVSYDGYGPSLVTPAIDSQRAIPGLPGMHQPLAGAEGPTSFCSCNKRKGESCTFCWAWDMRSETSAASLWSASVASTARSLRSQPGQGPGSGQYVIGGDVDACTVGQRLLYVRPQALTTTGGKVYIELKWTIPQTLYSEIEVLLVAGKQGTVTLKPEAIKKGKKLCVVIPKGLAEEQDYDVRVKFAGKTLHGSFPLEIRAAVEESD